MTTNLHVVCRHMERRNWKKLDETIDGRPVYQTGLWAVTDARAEQIAAGGRVYLHDKQKELAWHGGTVVGWGRASDDPSRKFFTYVVVDPFRIYCPGKWGQEICFVEQHDEPV